MYEWVIEHGRATARRIHALCASGSVRGIAGDPRRSPYRDPGRSTAIDRVSVRDQPGGCRRVASNKGVNDDPGWFPTRTHRVPFRAVCPPWPAPPGAEPTTALRTALLEPSLWRERLGEFALRHRPGRGARPMSRGTCSGSPSTRDRAWSRLGHPPDGGGRRMSLLRGAAPALHLRPRRHGRGPGRGAGWHRAIAFRRGALPGEITPSESYSLARWMIASPSADLPARRLPTSPTARVAPSSRPRCGSMPNSSGPWARCTSRRTIKRSAKPSAGTR